MPVQPIFSYINPGGSFSWSQMAYVSTFCSIQIATLKLANSDREIA